MTFFRPDSQLTTAGMEILEMTWSNFPQLAKNQIALTWIVYDPPVIVNTGGAISHEEFWKYSVRGFSYRGGERIYPASIVKLFYLVAIQEWLEGEMIPFSPELNRAIRDMIVESSNDATSLVVDVLSGTTSGPELSNGPYTTWKYQRNIVNRYYQSLGWPELETVNINQKTWSDGPYGRERMFLGELMENRNMVTTEAVARLLHSIIGGVAVSSGRSQEMMNLLKRNLEEINYSKKDEQENQIIGFLGQSLPNNAQIWSKAGWTSQVHHDAAYIEIPGKSPYLLVVFIDSKEAISNRELLPFISAAIIEALPTTTK